MYIEMAKSPSHPRNVQKSPAEYGVSVRRLGSRSAGAARAPSLAYRNDQVARRPDPCRPLPSLTRSASPRGEIG